MTLLALAIVSVGMAAQGDHAIDKPVSYSMVAIQATTAGLKNGQKSFDKDLEKIVACLKSLPFDTYKKVKSDSGQIPPGKEAVVKLTEAYTLHISVLGQDDQERLRVRAWVEEKVKKDGKEETRKALDTTTAVATDKHVVLGGLDMPEGKLIIVLKFPS